MSLIDQVFVFIVSASPVCLNFVPGSRWLVVGLDNGTVMVSLTSFCAFTFKSNQIKNTFI